MEEKGEFVFFSSAFGYILTAIIILVALILTLACWIYYRATTGPFHTKYKQNAKPLVTDQRARDKVLKQGR